MNSGDSSLSPCEDRGKDDRFLSYSWCCREDERTPSNQLLTSSSVDRGAAIGNSEKVVTDIGGEHRMTASVCNFDDRSKRFRGLRAIALGHSLRLPQFAHLEMAFSLAPNNTNASSFRASRSKPVRIAD